MGGGVRGEWEGGGGVIQNNKCENMHGVNPASHRSSTVCQ